MNKTINVDEADEFIGYVEGYIATSSPDAHGDIIPPALIEEMAKRLEVDPQLQVMTLNHDPTQKTGRILEIRVDKKPGWAGLWARAGVFKSRPDVWKQFESGELRGFSVTVGVKDYSGKLPVDQTSGECEFRVVVPGAVWHEVDDLLRGAGAETYPLVRKALPAETVIYVSGSVASVSSLIFSIVGWLMTRRKQSGKDGQDIDVSVLIQEDRIRVTPDTAERIVRRVQMSSKKKGREKGD